MDTASSRPAGDRGLALRFLLQERMFHAYARGRAFAVQSLSKRQRDEAASARRQR